MYLQMCGKTSSKLELMEVFYKLVLRDFVYYNDLRVHMSLLNRVHMSLKITVM